MGWVGGLFVGEPFESASASAGLARRYFLALAAWKSVVSADGNPIASWRVVDTAVDHILLEMVIPARFRTGAPAPQRRIDHLRLESGKLTGFSIDGVSVAHRVRLLTSPAGMSGWAISPADPKRVAIVVMTSSLRLDGSKPASGRRVAAAEGVVETARGEVQMHAAAWSVRGGLMIELVSPRQIPLEVDDLERVRLTGLSAAPIEFAPLARDSARMPQTRVGHLSADDSPELSRIVCDMLPSATIEELLQVELLATELARQAREGDASGSELDRARLAVRQAASILNLTDG